MYVNDPNILLHISSYSFVEEQHLITVAGIWLSKIDFRKKCLLGGRGYFPCECIFTGTWWIFPRLIRKWERDKGIHTPQDKHRDCETIAWDGLGDPHGHRQGRGRLSPCRRACKGRRWEPEPCRRSRMALRRLHHNVCRWWKGQVAGSLLQSWNKDFQLQSWSRDDFETYFFLLLDFFQSNLLKHFASSALGISILQV